MFSQTLLQLISTWDLAFDVKEKWISILYFAACEHNTDFLYLISFTLIFIFVKHYPAYDSFVSILFSVY